jgi:hypothetical protein
MLLLLIITLPACVELAAWLVDSSFEKYLQELWPGSAADDTQ